MRTSWVRSRLGTPRRPTPLGVGLAFIVVAIVSGVLLFNKAAIVTALKPGETIEVHFAANNGLVDDLSQAKVAWVPVGVVSDVEERDDGTVFVSLKVDNGTTAKLGSRPSAVIRPTTLLGGSYFVDLVPGGDRGEGAFSGTIPLERTKLPVELDDVARTLQPNVLTSLRGTTEKLDETLSSDAQGALRDLVAEAPETLQPATEVLAGLRGNQPRTDLTKVVSGLEGAARALSQQNGQLDAIMTGLDQTTAVLGRRSGDLAEAVSTLPSTLDSTRAGLARLDTTLGKLRDTAGPARPVVTALTDTLRHLNPALEKARPVVSDTTRLLRDLEPVVGQLVPLAERAHTVLSDIDGAAAARLNGPLKQFVLTPFKGRDRFATAQSDAPLYQDLGYMIALLDRAGMNVDRNGHSVGVAPGVNGTSLAMGEIEAMLRALSGRSAATKGAG